MIFYGHHQVDDADVACVSKVLSEALITQGPVVEEFEQAISQYCECPYSTAVNSGTSALYLACRLLGIQSGDWVWTTAISYVASANCAALCGAQLKFLDIELETFNLDLVLLRSTLEHAARIEALPKAIIVVHFAGLAIDMKQLHRLVDPYGIKIIEDACHALGSRYPSGEQVGCCLYSEFTVLSFHPVKAITTAEGGMLLTRKEAFKRRADTLRSGGVTRDGAAFERNSHGPWYYEQQELGLNFRMPDLLAALGLSQLQKLPQFIEKRKALIRTYLQHSDKNCLRLVDEQYLARTNYHLCVAMLPTEITPRKKCQLFERMAALGVMLNVHYIPIYQQPFYRNYCQDKEIYLDKAEAYYRSAVTLPLFVGLCHFQVKRIITQMQTQIMELVAEREVCYG